MKLNKEIFAHNAKMIRLSLGKNQNEFGELINTSRSNIGAIEEARSWSVDLVFQYSQLSKMTMEFLISYKMNLPNNMKNKRGRPKRLRAAKRIKPGEFFHLEQN